MYILMKNQYSEKPPARMRIKTERKRKVFRLPVVQHGARHEHSAFAVLDIGGSKNDAD